MASISYNALLGVLFAFVGVVAVVAMVAAFKRDLFAVILGVAPLWVFIAAVVALASAVNAQLAAVLRIQGRAFHYAGLLLAVSVSNMSLSLLFVAVFRWGWQGRVAGIALATAAAGSFAVVALRRMGFARGQMDKGLLRSLFRISVPLVPHQLSGRITAMSSRLFLNGLAGKEAVGLYSVGYTFGALLHLPMEAFNNAWLPWVFKRLAARSQKNDSEIARLAYLVLLGLVGLWVLVAIAVPYVLRAVTDVRYHAASQFIVWIGLAFVFQAVYELLVPILIDAAKTDAMAVFTGIVAALSLALNWILIRQFGVIGAAYTAVACAAAKACMVFWYAQRVRPMPWCAALRYWR